MRVFVVLCAGILLITASGFGSADPAAAQSSNRSCFWPRNARNFRSSTDDRTVFVRTNARDVWALEFFAPCQGVSWAHRAQVRVRGGGGTVCEGRANAVDVHVPAWGSTRRQRCSVSNVRKLSTDEIAALPRSARP